MFLIKVGFLPYANVFSAYDRVMEKWEDRDERDREREREKQTQDLHPLPMHTQKEGREKDRKTETEREAAYYFLKPPSPITGVSTVL